MRILGLLMCSVIMVGCGDEPAPMTSVPEEPPQQPVDWSKGSRLVTPSREIVLVHECPEGCIGCDDIKVRLTRKDTGEQRFFIGEVDHHLHPQTRTPGAFRGWRFRDGEKDYFISNDDMLTISKNNTTLEREQGAWNP